mgnify:CR=1 FL=1
MRQSGFHKVLLVWRKEVVCGLRFKAVWAVMLMFALPTLACVSLALGGAALTPPLLAALLWIILFFAAMVGLEHSFADEAASGTLLALRVYGPAQAVLFGKIFYVFCLLLGMALAIVPLFLVLLDALPVYAGTFLAVLAAGLWGIAAAGTLVAAIASSTAVQGGLFSILLLPVILPLFLPAISLTSAAFGGGELSGAMLASMLCYDAAVTAGASILFDYVW